LPLIDTVGFVRLSVVLVCAGDISANPEPAFTCHFTVGAGEPLAAAVKLALAPYVID
jgi:hypothetical protein